MNFFLKIYYDYGVAKKKLWKDTNVRKDFFIPLYLEISFKEFNLELSFKRTTYET